MDNVLSELVKKLEKGESVSNLVSEFKISEFELFGYVRKLKETGINVIRTEKNNEVRLIINHHPDYTKENVYNINVDVNLNTKFAVISDTRFGSTNEIGVFEMKSEGLVEVENPSEYMLNGRPENASGTVTACTIEGTRPILIEIQALVCQTNFGIPRRQASGADFNRLNLLMAVLEKRRFIM